MSFDPIKKILRIAQEVTRNLELLRTARASVVVPAPDRCSCKLPNLAQEPFSEGQVTALVSHIRLHGRVGYSNHAVEEMNERELNLADVATTLRCGGVDYAGLEHKDDSYRYRICTPKITVVVAFRSENELSVVTAWRNEQQ